MRCYNRSTQFQAHCISNSATGMYTYEQHPDTQAIPFPCITYSRCSHPLEQIYPLTSNYLPLPLLHCSYSDRPIIQHDRTHFSRDELSVGVLHSNCESRRRSTNFNPPFCRWEVLHPADFLIDSSSKNALGHSDS